RLIEIPEACEQTPCARRSLSAPCPGCVLLARVPFGQPPSLHHHLLAGRPTSFGGFHGTSRLSDFPEPCTICAPSRLPDAGPRFLLPLAALRSPSSRAWCSRACAGVSDCAGPAHVSR